MKLPRDISGVDLAKRLGRIGYEVTRQAGSHLRLSTRETVSTMSPFPITTRLKWERWLEFFVTF
jgi:predicted RNA binding protein YcfA (HicA-like mRNA interferase family)